MQDRGGETREHLKMVAGNSIALPIHPTPLTSVSRERERGGEDKGVLENGGCSTNVALFTESALLTIVLLYFLTGMHCILNGPVHYIYKLEGI